jgi:hypothetical protein
MVSLLSAKKAEDMRSGLSIFLVSWVLWGQIFSPKSDAEAQAPPGRKVGLTLEAYLRQELKKIERWGVERLLQTEQRLDEQQKYRAYTSTNPEELALLAEDEDCGVRFFVGANSHTSPRIKSQLANDPVPYVRSGVAMSLSHDPKADPENQKKIRDIAERLARDSDELVRLSLAGNEKLSPVVFDTLASDPDFLVRQKLAENLHASGQALVILAQDSIEAVQIKAVQHRNMPQAWLARMSSHPSAQVRIAVCRNVNTPIKVLSSLATDPDSLVRRAVANHTNTSAKTLKRMIDDEDIEVLSAIAHHPKADRTTLMKLAFDERDAAVRMAAQKRLIPLLRSEIREDVLERGNSR